MKTTISFFTFLCMVLGMLSSCNNESYLSDCESNGTEVALWGQQLDSIKSSSPKTISKSLFINESRLTLVDYRILGEISTEDDLLRLRENLLVDDSYFPFYDVTNNKIEIKMLKEITSQKIEGITYSPEELEAFLEKILVLGMIKVELEWMCDSQIYKTICAVSDKSGIVYDNIISNILCLNEEEEINIQVKNGPVIRTKEAVADPHAKTLEWTLEKRCTWLWGSDRGSVHLYHSITGLPNDLQTSSFHAEHEMTIGSSDAQIRRVEYRRGNGGFSACAYGYHMSTPFLSVSLVFERGGFRLSGSTSMGSSIGATGMSELSSAHIPRPDPEEEDDKPKPEPH